MCTQVRNSLTQRQNGKLNCIRKPRHESKGPETRLVPVGVGPEHGSRKVPGRGAISCWIELSDPGTHTEAMRPAGGEPHRGTFNPAARFFTERKLGYESRGTRMITNNGKKAHGLLVDGGFRLKPRPQKKGRLTQTSNKRSRRKSGIVVVSEARCARISPLAHRGPGHQPVSPFT